MPKHVIAVVSGKGGVGKSTVALNYATLLSLQGVSTLLIDADFYNPCIGLCLGLWQQPVGFQHVLAGTAKIEDAVTLYPASGLRVCLSSLNYFRSVKTENLKRIIEKLDYDVIVIDSPPGLSGVVEDIVTVCNELFIVLTPDVPSVTSATKLAAITEANPAAANNPRVFTYILNRVANRSWEMHPQEVERLFNKKLAALVPEDFNIPESMAVKTPVVLYNPDAPASKRFREFAKVAFYESRISSSYKTKKGPIARLMEIIKGLLKI